MCLRIATNSWHSNTSPFYNTYRKTHDLLSSKHEDSIPDIQPEETEEFLAKIDKLLKDLDWYSRELFKVSIEQRNTSAMSRELKIPRTSISLTLKRVKDHIKQNLKNE